MTGSLHAIVQAVSAETGVEPGRIMSLHRGRPDAVRARWMTMHIYRTWDPNDPPTLTSMGLMFQRDRSTVRDGIRAFLRLCARDATVKMIWTRVMDRLAAAR